MSETKAASPSSKKFSGTCKWFNSKKGFGFIAPSGGGADVFVHQTVIHAEGFRSLGEGEQVEYNTETDSAGKIKAIDVTGPSGAYVKGAPKPNYSQPRRNYNDRNNYSNDRGSGGNDRNTERNDRNFDRQSGDQGGNYSGGGGAFRGRGGRGGGGGRGRGRGGYRSNNNNNYRSSGQNNGNYDNQNSDNQNQDS